MNVVVSLYGNKTTEKNDADTGSGLDSSSGVETAEE